MSTWVNFLKKFTFGLRCASVFFHSTLKPTDYDVDCTLNAGFHRNNLKLRHAVCYCLDNTLIITIFSFIKSMHVYYGI